MPGPAPTPSALNALHGWPGKRRRNRQEPQPTGAGLEPPLRLTPAARAIWDRHAPELSRLNLLTKLDTTAYVNACRLQALGDAYAVDAEAAAMKPPTRKGRSRRPPPATATAIKCWERAALIFARFGMTPADRTRVQAAATPHAHDYRNPLQALRAKRPIDRLA